MWTLLRQVPTQIIQGALYQGARNNVDVLALALYAAPPSRAAYERLGEAVEALMPKTPAFRAGRVLGSAATTAQGLWEVGTGATIWTGGTAVSCILGGPPTGMLGCAAGGSASTAVGVPILVDGLGVTATSLGNGMQNVVSLFKGNGGEDPRATSEFFEPNGVRTSDEFWGRLDKHDITEGEAWKAYTKGSKYRASNGSRLKRIVT